MCVCVCVCVFIERRSDLTYFIIISAVIVLTSGKQRYTKAPGTTSHFVFTEG